MQHKPQVREVKSQDPTEPSMFQEKDRKFRTVNLTCEEWRLAERPGEERGRGVVSFFRPPDVQLPTSGRHVDCTESETLIATVMRKR
jgi:hypothetical protein